jgi:hypothetical protein
MARHRVAEQAAAAQTVKIEPQRRIRAFIRDSAFGNFAVALLSA